MLAVVATLTIKAGGRSDFEALAKALVARVCAEEPGCKLYVLHRDSTRPGTYVFLERYSSQAAFEAHKSTEYFKTFGEQIRELVEGPMSVLRLLEVE